MARTLDFRITVEEDGAISVTHRYAADPAPAVVSSPPAGVDPDFRVITIAKQTDGGQIPCLGVPVSILEEGLSGVTDRYAAAALREIDKAKEPAQTEPTRHDDATVFNAIPDAPPETLTPVPAKSEIALMESLWETAPDVTAVFDCSMPSSDDSVIRDLEHALAGGLVGRKEAEDDALGAAFDEIDVTVEDDTVEAAPAPETAPPVKAMKILHQPTHTAKVPDKTAKQEVDDLSALWRDAPDLTAAFTAFDEGKRLPDAFLPKAPEGDRKDPKGAWTNDAPVRAYGSAEDTPIDVDLGEAGPKSWEDALIRRAANGQDDVADELGLPPDWVPEDRTPREYPVDLDPAVLVGSCTETLQRRIERNGTEYARAVEEGGTHQTHGPAPISAALPDGTNRQRPGVYVRQTRANPAANYGDGSVLITPEAVKDAADTLLAVGGGPYGPSVKARKPRSGKVRGTTSAGTETSGTAQN